MSDPGLLGFAVLAASLGPGYVFERVAERRRPRIPRSTLGETVELIVTGAFFTIVAAMIVLTIGHPTHWLDVRRLAAHATSYLVQHPGRALSAIAALYALSFALAALAARILYRNTTAQIKPGAVPWHHILLQERPEGATTFVVLSLRDGSEVGGVLSAYSLGGDNREIALVTPMAIRPADGSDPQLLSEDFVLLRESDVARVRGHYVT